MTPERSPDTTVKKRRAEEPRQRTIRPQRDCDYLQPARSTLIGPNIPVLMSAFHIFFMT